ncbi:MAG: hypothetical protein RLO18_09450 [Gimesia chilikensis]
MSALFECLQGLLLFDRFFDLLDGYIEDLFPQNLRFCFFVASFDFCQCFGRRRVGRTITGENLFSFRGDVQQFTLLGATRGFNRSERDPLSVIGQCRVELFEVGIIAVFLDKALGGLQSGLP